MSGVFWQNLENRAGLINLLQHSMSVPISATGLQGEQPLVHGTNVGKGSRQNGSVTSGEGLALGIGYCNLIKLLYYGDLIEN